MGSKWLSLLLHSEEGDFGKDLSHSPLPSLGYELLPCCISGGAIPTVLCFQPPEPISNPPFPVPFIISSKANVWLSLIPEGLSTHYTEGSPTLTNVSLLL